MLALLIHAGPSLSQDKPLTSPMVTTDVQRYVTGPVVSRALSYTPDLKDIDSSNTKEIPDMPRFQLQGGMGSCFGCAASTMVQKFLCDHDPDFRQPGRPCAATPPELSVSQLSMVAWADVNRPRTGSESDQRSGESRNHTNLKIYAPERTRYGNAVNALVNAQTLFRFMPESCFPIERLAQKYADQGGDSFEMVYSKGRSMYERLRLKPDCEACRLWFSGALNTSFNPESMVAASAKESYPEFLYALIFYKCKPIWPTTRPRFKAIDLTPKPEVFGIIRSVIDQGRPVLVNQICLTEAPCTASHSIVISGYRRACGKLADAQTCRHQLKVHNCWGPRWQAQNNDGWMDANLLIEYIRPGQSDVEPGSVSWYE